MSDEMVLRDLRNRWLAAKEELNNARAMEQDLRLLLYEQAFKGNKSLNAKNEALGIAARIPKQYTIDQAAYEAMLPVLREEGIPDDIVFYKAQISKRNLDKLSITKLSLLSQCIEEKYGIVQLTVI